MTDPPPDSRPDYRPSGKVAWLRFLIGLVVAAGVAAAMAWCLFFAFWNGFYLIFIAPLIAALPVAGVWHRVVTQSHCRNKRLAASTAFALALLLYFGYFYVGLLHLIGVQNARRIDVLPKYVQFRMNTDVAHDVGRPNVNPAGPRGPNRVQQAFNWFFFGGELLMVIGVMVTVAQHASGRAYCESCGRWAKSETLKLSPGVGPTLWDAMQRADYTEVHQRLASTAPQTAIGCALTIEYCPTCPAESRAPAVYLTIKDVASPGSHVRVVDRIGALFKPRTSSGMHTFLDHVALYPDEAGALAATFPGLKKSIETHPDLFAEARSTAREIGRAQEARVSEWKQRFARIEAVDPRDAGTILTRKNAIIQTIIGIVTIFGGFGLAFGPAGVLTTRDPKPPEWILGISVVWLFVGLVLNVIWVMCVPLFITARFMLRQTRNAFDLRADPAVDMRNPDLFFVDIVPRTNWGKAMMENASDIGFLELNKARRELIFEGDRERYWIPVESILEIKHEYWSEAIKHQLQSQPTQHHLVVVRAMTNDGPWETWFYQRQKKVKWRNAKQRLADALELESKIRDLMASKS
jgi:hypothetical protein